MSKVLRRSLGCLQFNHVSNMLLAEDHYLCKITKSNTETETGTGETGTGESQRFPWIWTLVVVLLSTYGLALSITALVFWVRCSRKARKLRGRVSNSHVFFN